MPSRLLSGLKQPELKFNNSSPSNAHVKNEIRPYTFTVLYVFIAYVEKCYFFIDYRNIPHGALVSVSQPPGRGPVPGPDINYIGPRKALL